MRGRRRQIGFSGSSRGSRSRFGPRGRGSHAKPPGPLLPIVGRRGPVRILRRGPRRAMPALRATWDSGVHRRSVRRPGGRLYSVWGDGTLVAQILDRSKIARASDFRCGASAFAVMIGGGLGCTANVENKKVNENGNDTEATCMKICLTSCSAKCNDGGCKATCTTDHDHCTTACTPADGG
jgi:hypothetical protein